MGGKSVGQYRGLRKYIRNSGVKERDIDTCITEYLVGGKSSEQATVATRNAGPVVGEE
jgi:hypothetical protein